MKKITFMTMAMVAAMSAGTAMTLASCSEAGSLKTSISTDNDRYVVTEGKIVKQYLKVGKFISVRIEGSPTVKFVQGNKHEVIVQGTKEYVGSSVDGDGNEIKIYKRNQYVIKPITKIMKDEDISEGEAYKKYAHLFFQTAMPQSSIRPRVMEKVKELGIQGDLWSIEYIPKTGRNKGKVYEQFYKGDSFRLFAWLKDVSDEIDGKLCKKDLQGTYWDFTQYINNLTVLAQEEVTNYYNFEVIGEV